MATSPLTNQPPAEPGSRDDGASVGGMAASADKGLADSLQRSSERGDDDGLPPPAGSATGVLGGGPRVDLGGKTEPGSAPGAGGATAATGQSDSPTSAPDDVQPKDGGADGRPAPVAPESAPLPTTRSGGGSPRQDQQDESALESLGRSVSEAVTGATDDPLIDPAVPQRHGDRA